MAYFSSTEKSTEGIVGFILGFTKEYDDRYHEIPQIDTYTKDTILNFFKENNIPVAKHELRVYVFNKYE